MKFLGIDYGTKRIGIAVSDERAVLAFPRVILKNDKNIFKNIRQIIAAENPQAIVVGESLNFKGRPNRIAAEIETFILELEKFNLPTHSEKEFLTSVEARRYSEAEKADASAAALILQRYLDRKNLL